MLPDVISLVALLLGAIGTGLGAFMWLKVDPRTLLNRMLEIEAQQPRYHQELSAWTVATEAMLEACEVKLKKAHARSGGRPRKEPPPDNGPPVPMDRAAVLRDIERRLRATGQIS